MGSLLFGNSADMSLKLKSKVLEFLEDKNIKKEIIEYFNSYENLSKPNDITRNSDKAIEKIYYPKENKYNLCIHIYNIPGVLRMNNGLFQIIGETMMIFQLFFNKYNELEEENFKEKFDEFFDALLNADCKKIYDLILIKINETDLIKKKQGLDTLIEMFGEQNIKSYYNTVLFSALGSGIALAIGNLFFRGITSTLTASTASTPLGISIIIIFVGYCIYRKIYDKNMEKVKNSYQKIKDFYDRVQDVLSNGAEYYTQDGLKNLFVIAIDRENNLVKDICMFPYYIKELKSSNCPTLGKDAPSNSNSEYYSVMLDACKYYIEKYSLKIHNHINNVNQDYNLQNEIENDFRFLKSAKMIEIKERIKPLDEIEKFLIIQNNQNIMNGMNNMNEFEFDGLKTSPVSRKMSIKENNDIKEYNNIPIPQKEEKVSMFA